jgi:alkylation response protein AidB-like acyl-CoA dehydrogenase
MFEQFQAVELDPAAAEEAAAAVGAAAEEHAVKAAAAEFARRALNDRLVERDRLGEFSHQAWRACAEFGVQRLAVPPVYGGLGASLRTVMATMEGLGLGCGDNGLLFSLNAQLWSVQHPLVRFGTEEQKRQFLPALCNGELIGVHAMTEPESGSDAFSLQTRAVRSGNSYRLTGRKTFITNAPIGDVAIVFATVDPEMRLGGITAFLVELDRPGVHQEHEWDKMGLRTSPMGQLLFEDCEIPIDHRLGAEGGGAAIFNSSMEWERAGILSVAVGAMERELNRCIEYAKSRRQFNQPIGKFPAVSNRIADMQVRLTACRALLRHVAEVKDAGRPAAMEAAIAKLFISEAWVQSGLDAQLTYGAYGYLRENGIEREVRDALASRIYSGTSDIQRLVIAQRLGLG